MAVKKPKIQPRTFIYIVVVLLVILGIAYIALNPPTDSEDYLSVSEVIRNKENYIGKEITVKGVYYTSGDDDYLIPVVTTTAKPNPDEMLLLNLENIVDNNTLENFTTGNNYAVSGELVDISEIGPPIVELIASEIKFI